MANTQIKCIVFATVMGSNITVVSTLNMYVFSEQKMNTSQKYFE